MRTRRTVLLILPLVGVVLLSGCDKGMAYGDPNAVIVTASPEVWPALEDSVYTALSPTIFTVREERTFRVSYQDPTTEDWVRLRRFREEVLIGTPEDPWMAEALDALGRKVEVTPPQVVEVADVWARGQHLTLLVLDPERDAASQVLPLLPEVFALLDARFRAGVKARMFTSGADSALADTLWQTAGFRLLLPRVYRWSRTDSIYIFRNDNPDPSELIRQFTVTRKSPIPAGYQPDSLIQWRTEVAEVYFSYPQVADLSQARGGPFLYGPHQAYEIRAVWSNPPESQWPAAGPFILRAIVCRPQNRMYLVDSWLYAPGRDKWEYMLQLEEILNSFRCT